MPVTLDTITLPDDIHWDNEFDNVPVGQISAFSVTGAQILQTSAQQAGRSIVLLANGDGDVWVYYSDVIALRAKAATPPTSPMVLTLLDGRTFNVMWDYANKAIESKQVVDFANDGSDDAMMLRHTLTLRFITV